MKGAFYENRHGIGSDYFTVECRDNYSFPVHMHRCFEVIHMLSGEMRVMIEGEYYDIRDGDFILIKPNRIHSLQALGECRHILCIFSPELVGAVSERLIKKRLDTPCAAEEDGVCRRLFLSLSPEDGVCRIKGFLYLLCDMFVNRLTTEDDGAQSADMLLLHRIFNFIEENYSKACALTELSESLSYDYSYLSRLFSEYVGMPYSAYVAQMRINRACELLNDTDGKITDIAAACGFNSLRSFNRNFLSLTGKTPSEYRGTQTTFN